MPSIQDVADQINARLDQITISTSETRQHASDILDVSKDISLKLDQNFSRLVQINGTLVAGFTNISDGLSNLIKVQLAALHLHDHNRKQNDTIICELKNSNELLCNIMRKLGQQLALSESSLISIERLEGIFERVESGSAADYDRNLEFRNKMEECCPPESAIEEDCPGGCEIPLYKGRIPGKVIWKPIKFDSSNEVN